jgi:hypothetical protein
MGNSGESSKDQNSGKNKENKDHVHFQVEMNSLLGFELRASHVTFYRRICLHFFLYPKTECGGVAN